MRAVQSSPDFCPTMCGLRAGTDETHRLARNRHPHLDLRADRDELDEGTERVHQERVPFVLAVEADLASQQAGGDSDAKTVGHGRPEA